jgi:hypothetical protein
MRRALLPFYSKLICALLLFCASLSAQTITGTIVGTVTDPSGAAIANADVTLTQTTTSAQRKTKTLADGNFTLSALEPGEYSIAVTAAGFTSVEKTGLQLTAAERLSAGNLVLQLGQTSESVTVKADIAVVQTESAEKSGVLTTQQIDNQPIKGRNVITFLQLLPGVVDTNAPDAPDRNFAIGLSINGNRRNAIGTTMDGVQTQDSGVGWIATANISIDAIAEVKVLLNNYQAEYGRMRGAGVLMIGKSGTRDFHGSFNYFKRHEQFNANDFFNNRNGVTKPRYRYNMYSYTIGGPAYIPKLFNTDRNKLFFFWSQEYWPQKTGVPTTFVNMPSALERTGDFSQSLDVNNRLITVKDPLTGQPFPGNIVPANRIDPNGQALLKFLPLPNFANRQISGGQYNYVNQVELNKPQRLQTMKIDNPLTSKDIFSVTWSRQRDTQTGAMGLATPNSNWPAEYRTFETVGNIVSGRYHHIFSPTMVNELVLGDNWRTEHEDIPSEVMQRISKAGVGYNAPDLFPAANPLNLIPNVTFGGIPNAANITLTNTPLKGRYQTYSITENVSKTFRTHNAKAGIFLNRQSVISAASTNRGALNFSVDSNNPLDTGYTYSNALLGVFASAAQPNRIVQTSTIYKAYEWFVQDSWKVSRRFSLELGLRFVKATTPYTNHVAGMFSPTAWKASDAPMLIRPTLVNGARRGIDPITGTIYPAVAIGQLVPGVGNFANGVILNNQPGVPRGLVNSPALQYNPRFGFAWDVFGNGKTAVRGGFGLFQSSGANGEGAPGSETIVPLVRNVTVPYSTLSALGTSSGLLSPPSFTYRQDPMGLATNYNMSFGIQQSVGWGFVLDTGYVGNLGRHLNWAFDMAPVPLGANFNPNNIDTSTTTRSPLPTNFLRSAYPGFAGVTYQNWGATSNYHSLQTTLNRRFSRGFQFGLSYTWSKFLDAVDFDGNTVSPFVPARQYNYGLSTYDRTHNLRTNFLYQTPRVWYNNPISKWALNGWEISGINAFISGAPTGVGFTTTNNADITGTSSQGPRIDVIGNPVLPKDQRTFAKNFRTDVFRLPAVGTLGNAGRTLLRGPGVENWDLSLFKNFPIREPFRLQFRAEAYNAFNHTQFSSFDTTARFDAAGNQVNPTLGQFNATRTPRQIQLAVRFTF